MARRIGVGLDPASTWIRVGEAWHDWLSGKKRLRASSHERLEVAGKHWILPVLADVSLERLNGAQVAEVFARRERISTEIIARRGTSRAYVRVEGDVRTRPRTVGVASQHRVYAALREFCNFELRKTRRLSFNPVYAVELAPEVTPEARRWSAAQARTFLTATKSDPTRPAVPCRASARRAAQRGGRTAVGGRRSRRGQCPYPEAHRARQGRDHREHAEDQDRRPPDLAGRRNHPHPEGAPQGAAQDAARGGERWQDSDLIFCKDDGDGTPFKPDYVTRRFKRLSALGQAAGDQAP